MTLMSWLAHALISLIEQFAALAFFLFGRNQHRASEQPYKGTRPPQPRAIALVWAEAAVDEGAAKQISDILKWFVMQGCCCHAEVPELFPLLNCRCAQEELRDFIVYDPSGESRTMGLPRECTGCGLYHKALTCGRACTSVFPSRRPRRAQGSCGGAPTRFTVQR